MCSRSLRAATIVAASLMAGCHQLQSDFTDWRLSKQIRRDASQAWDDCNDVYRHDVYYLSDFGDGFEAGYAQILGGGDVCPPTLPPEKYWKARFQTAEGRDKIDTWFAGHEAGVATALQDGVGGANKIPLSPFRRAQLAGYRSCPSCYPSADTGPAYNYDFQAVPPTPEQEMAPGEPVTEADEMPAEEEYSDAEFVEPAEVEIENEPVAPVNYRFADDTTVQE